RDPTPEAFHLSRARSIVPMKVIEPVDIRRKLVDPGRPAVEPKQVGDDCGVLPGGEASRVVLGHRGTYVLKEITDRLGHPGELEERTSELTQTMANRANISENHLPGVGLGDRVESRRGGSRSGGKLR